jgi:formylglycine-generating enzyme required for sulfatase activity
MKILFMIARLSLALLLLGEFVPSTLSQEVTIPDPALNALVRATLGVPDGPVTQPDMLRLTNLVATFRNITSLQGLGAARNLTNLVLDDNHLTDLSFLEELSTLTSLAALDLSENDFTVYTLPPGLTNLTRLRMESSGLTSLALPAGLTALRELRIGFNQLSELPLRSDMTNLSILSAFNNRVTNFVLPPNLQSLTEIFLDGNELSRLVLPGGLTNLTALVLGENHLTSIRLPADITNLSALRINDNQLTNIFLPPGLDKLSFLYLLGNQLSNLSLPSGMTNLRTLVVNGNQLTNITLPPDVTRLATLFAAENPLTSLVLSEDLASTGLASLVNSFTNQGISVFTYPLQVQLLRPRSLIGAFQFGISGPPGVYSVFSSTHLPTWTLQAVSTNNFGAVNFLDVSAGTEAKLFQAFLQTAPSNMVFIPPNTFTMGSPTNELHRDSNEGPQTVVTLTRGFWIGRFEVTQAEYLSLMQTNPSAFPGDLSRPVSNVSWPDATNYCAQLTARELAAGRISPGTRYRLPTEAEWECAARAGTTTRFSFGDDPTYSSLTNHAWFNFEGGMTVHPVGQKLPNSWGLYDMEGNVFEWCQDWLGPLPGGTVVDPVGPDTNPIGWKVMRGGAFDFSETSCRSAARSFFPSHPALNDWNLGFRVVLSSDP